jgi:hypothetical protein
VTSNLKDFPAAQLDPYDVEALHPDDFVSYTFDLAPGKVANVVSEQAAALKNPPQSVAEVLDTLRLNGLAQSVAKLRSLMGATLG